VSDLGGQFRPQLARVARHLGEVGEADLGKAAVAERRGAREALVEDAAEGVDVTPARRLASFDQLRCEVVRGAENLTVRRQARGVSRAREAEVGQRGRALAVEEHVRGLHVAVEDPLRVEGVEPFAELCRQVERFAHAQVPERPQTERERAAWVVRHDQVREPL
jgi:hypothetical protein